jgi:sporulation protein YlmC with PRC-barrel domain
VKFNLKLGPYGVVCSSTSQQCGNINLLPTAIAALLQDCTDQTAREARRRTWIKSFRANTALQHMLLLLSNGIHGGKLAQVTLNLGRGEILTIAISFEQLNHSRIARNRQDRSGDIPLTTPGWDGYILLR